jgi:putative two-component system response regulator
MQNAHSEIDHEVTTEPPVESLPSATVAQQLALAHSQLVLYARDLKTAFTAEKQKSKELEEAYYDTMLRLVRATLYKTGETVAHLRRIGRYVHTLALHLGMEATQANLLCAAAALYDVGKIGVPDAVLLKRGPLNPWQWEALKKHTTLGAGLLNGSSSPLLEMARQIALTHHEYWNGEGYPQGLRGEEIPLAGRIVMLASQYDALRSPRPHKPALEHAKVCHIILNGDERTQPAHFDPLLLKIFRNIHSEFASIYDHLAQPYSVSKPLENGSSF